MHNRLFLRSAFLLLALAGCATQDAPTAPAAATLRPPSGRSLSSSRATPPFNMEVSLRGNGFGGLKFRQKDTGHIVYLDTWVRDLAPNTAYLLQRAVDANVDNDCTSTAWLTLGKGLTPQAIVTDDRGTAREALYRDLSAVAPGSQFDIHFQVINAATSAVVLTSGCYQFTVR